RYEISNYAREGYECRHNLGYWERKEYLGLGTGAASLIREQRFHHISDTREYIENAHDPELLMCDREELSVREQMEEFMFLGLRKVAGVSFEKFEQEFGLDIHSVYGEIISKNVSLELMEYVGDKGVRLTERGIDISNVVLSDFLLT
ncbi:MAG: coproporphyrinogen III oxidase, partial [Lachnospira sp.]|nr:coproporphyrinogen III oxidase [Lachnospira sp.]